MRSSVTLEIDSRPAHFNTVWIHLKCESKFQPVPFRISIPKAQLREIFDPHCTKPVAESWDKFIRNRIESLGTFILEAYVTAMARVAGNEERQYEWVITRVDNIIEKAEGVELVGQAEAFTRQGSES